MSRETEALLLSAARAELVDKVIQPALHEGRLVVCDRFWDATIAYQGHGRGLPIDSLMFISMLAARRLTPDITFLLDIPQAVSQQRLHGRSADRLEGEALAFFERVAEGYRRLAAAEPNRFVVVDGRRPPAELAAQLRTTVLSRWRG